MSSPDTSLAPVVTSEQIDLVKRTVAGGATDAELKQFLFDCARQGVHPLDRLLHFTKRKGKYTPITSIDFMRIRAADTGEYAGSDDAVFSGTPKTPDFAATVTVWRLVQGQRCAFTATARWSEYKPAENDFMWVKMAHTMLAKCGEALALRKGFPRSLAGLYAKEEMDQAGTTDTNYTVEPPAVAEVELPQDGLLRIISVTAHDTRNPHIKRHVLVLSDGREVVTLKTRLAALAEQLCQEREPVRVTTKTSKYGEDLDTLTRASADENRRLDAELSARMQQEPDDVAF